MARKRVSGFSDYIIPIAVVAGGYVVLNSLGVFGTSGGGGLLPAAPSIGPSPTSPQGQANASSVDSLDAIIKARNANVPPQDCFTGYLYKQDPSNASIDLATATNLWNNVHAAAGTWFTVGDFTGIQADFQAVVGNQTDISLVASLFEQNDGKDMLYYMLNHNTFGNEANSAQNNIQLVTAFFQWCLSLPVD